MRSDLAEHAVDLEAVSRLDGMFVGLLDDGEIAAFDRLCGAGLAHRSYEGAGGFMGLAKVRFAQVNHG